MESTVRILHVLGNTNLGGAESRIMDLYRHIDRGRVQFDFLVHTAREGYYDKEITALGGRVYRVPRFRIYNYFTYVHELKRFFWPASRISDDPGAYDKHCGNLSSPCKECRYSGHDCPCKERGGG